MLGHDPFASCSPFHPYRQEINAPLRPNIASTLRQGINAAYKAYCASMSDLDTVLEYMHVKFAAGLNLAPAVLAPRSRFVNLSRSYTVVNSSFTQLHTPKICPDKKMQIAFSQLQRNVAMLLSA
jgi:hypothetical protein